MEKGKWKSIRRINIKLLKWDAYWFLLFLLDDIFKQGSWWFVLRVVLQWRSFGFSDVCKTNLFYLIKYLRKIQSNKQNLLPEGLQTKNFKGHLHIRVSLIFICPATALHTLLLLNVLHEILKKKNSIKRILLTTASSNSRKRSSRYRVTNSCNINRDSEKLTISQIWSL